jgi:choline dehydrogenase-like flavoprotein
LRRLKIAGSPRADNSLVYSPARLGTDATAMTYDYVIVGAGSAGCVLAARLSEDPAVSVCLLEAGKRDSSPLIHVPLGLAALVPHRIHNWAFDTTPQPGLDGRRGYQPRGKTLGGSSSINAMVYTRGHRSDYDEWTALGNVGWSYADVLPYFRRSEHNERIVDAYHGQGGPLNVADQRSPSGLNEVFLAAAEGLGYRRNTDFNGAEQEGVGIYQVTQRNGQRCSAAAAYLTPNLGRPNLTVLTRAHATRVLFEGTRAAGVEFRQRGATKSVRANREVILSAGALQSPQLLMLSGIGDAEALAKLGIPVVAHAPGVGRGLKDHVDFIFAYRSQRTDLMGLAPADILRGGASAMRYWRDRRGIFTSNVAESGGFLKTSADLTAPDIQLHVCIGILESHGRRLHAARGYSCHFCLLRPKSAGSVMLHSADPLAPPAIDPAFYADPDDLETMVKAFKLTRAILDSPQLAPFRGRELFTADVRTDDEIRAVLRARSDTIYHPVSTCRMGVDELAVVDPQLRVRGIAGLRVVDASVMPTLIGGNTNAPTIMIAEKASDLIRLRHVVRPCDSNELACAR